MLPMITGGEGVLGVVTALGARGRVTARTALLPASFARPSHRLASCSRVHLKPLTVRTVGKLLPPQTHCVAASHWSGARGPGTSGQ